MQFEIEGVDQDVATRLIGELRRLLIRKGADPADMSLVRSDKNAMDQGSILQIASQLDFLVWAEKGLSIAVIAHCLYDLVRHHVVTIVVNNEQKAAKIRPTTMGVDEIVKLLEDITKKDAQ
jgi:hypothetical protein